MKYIFLALILTISGSLFAQNKKQLDHADVHRWRKIEQQKLSNNGQWALWSQTPVSEGDPTLHLWNAASGITTIFPRSSEAQFSDDSKWLVFKIKPALDTLKTLRRKKVKDEDLPKDTLGIFDLVNGKLEKIPRLKNFSLPEKWSGWLAFQVEMEKPVAVKKDTAVVKSDTIKTAQTPPATPPNGTNKAKKKTPKKEDKDNGYRLIVRNLPKGFQDTIAYVKEFTLAKRGPRLLLHATGKGDTLLFYANPKVLQNGIYLIDLEQYSLRPLLRTKGKFQQLALDDFGRQASFVADLDTTKARIRPWQLGYWKTELDSAKIITSTKSDFLTKFQSPLPAVAFPPAEPWRAGAKEGTNQPVTNQPTTNQPITNQPVTNQPITNQPVTNQPPPISGNVEIIEMDRMRRLISDHMVMSKHTSPHVTSFVEADVTNMVNWRNRVKDGFKKQYGENITFTPIFVEAVARAIRDFPMINISVDGTRIIVKKDINIGMAAALPSGNLIVPVIKNADFLNLAGLTKQVNDLANRARNNQLKPDEVQGGTFTLTNVGTFGNVMGTPIINQPQVAIMAMGAIRKKPAVLETEYGDVIAIRQMMFLSLSYDHRVVDGSLGGSFLRRVADYLEQFDANRVL